MQNSNFLKLKDVHTKSEIIRYNIIFWYRKSCLTNVILLYFIYIYKHKLLYFHIYRKKGKIYFPIYILPTSQIILEYI